jgi:hypothetical protein
MPSATRVLFGLPCEVDQSAEQSWMAAEVAKLTEAGGAEAIRR